MLHAVIENAPESFQYCIIYLLTFGVSKLFVDRGQRRDAMKIVFLKIKAKDPVKNVAR